MAWLYNTWYQAGWAGELTDAPLFTRTILGEPILFYRLENGDVAALLDRCPHRFVPLSAGVIADDAVTCPYHGLAFGPGGRCVLNPHGAITSSMAVRSFPAVQRHDAIWVWMGDADAADPATIPDLSFIDDAPETARFKMYIPTKAHYQLLTDNIMDLSHADFVHAQTLGGMMTHAKVRSRTEGDTITIDWTADGCVPAPAFAPMVSLDHRVDVWIEVTWRPPGVMVLRFSSVPAGDSRDVNVTALHNMVPENEHSTHYFMHATRTFEVDNPHVTAAMLTSAEQAFLREDKPMLENQTRGMQGAEFWSLKPVLLPVDAAAVRVRRKLDDLIKAEQTRLDGQATPRVKAIA